MFSRALYRSLIHVYLVYIHCTAPYIINNKAISKNTSKPKSRFPTALCTKKKEKKKRYHDHKATKTRIIQREKKKKRTILYQKGACFLSQAFHKRLQPRAVLSSNEVCATNVCPTDTIRPVVLLLDLEKVDGRIQIAGLDLVSSRNK